MFSTIFIGHGSPMNAIEENSFTKGWKKIANLIGKPKGIVCISAHWVTKDTKLLNVDKPKTIYDFYGFPKALYNIKYDVPETSKLKEIVHKELEGIAILDSTWGLDHGTWSVLNVMYPDADIPVIQISLDHYLSEEEHFSIGKKLRKLREKDILILGSGNVVHNLGIADIGFKGGYDFSHKFDDYIYDNIINRNFDKVINYKELGNIVKYSVPTTEHFDPLLYVLGAVDENDKIEVFNKEFFAGSVSMTSYVFSSKS